MHTDMQYSFRYSLHVHGSAYLLLPLQVRGYQFRLLPLEAIQHLSLLYNGLRHSVEILKMCIHIFHKVSQENFRLFQLQSYVLQILLFHILIPYTHEEYGKKIPALKFQNSLLYSQYTQIFLLISSASGLTHMEKVYFRHK